MAEWALVENNEIIELHDLLPVSWRNISGLRNAATNIEFLNSVGWYKVTKNNIEFDSTQYKIDNYTYSFNNNVVYETANLSKKEVVETATAINEVINEVVLTSKEKFMIELRAKRDLLLAKSDYTQLSDNIKKMTDEEIAGWEQYRQALRDLPAVYQDPSIDVLEMVNWPTLEIQHPSIITVLGNEV